MQSIRELRAVSLVQQPAHRVHSRCDRASSRAYMSFAHTLIAVHRFSRLLGCILPVGAAALCNTVCWNGQDGLGALELVI